MELTKNPDAMISALRKIEGRGELPGANSAVMEMCVDNPREGFSNLFDTHPSVDKRVEALVKFAGGHDPGPLALPAPPDAAPPSADSPNDDTPVGGPWGADPNRPNEPDGGQKGWSVAGSFGRSAWRTLGPDAPKLTALRQKALRSGDKCAPGRPGYVQECDRSAMLEGWN